MTLEQYIQTVTNNFNTGISTEHTYRGDLEQLIKTLVPNVEVTNEPSKVTDCGNPDYVITKRKIPIGFIEAKDIGKDLNSKVYKEQFTRYKKALDNLIITDYLWFQFFENGELVHEIRLANIENGKIIPNVDEYSRFTDLIKDFCTFISQTIKSPQKLAEMMAGKARLLQNIIEQAVTHDEKTELLSQQDTWLINQYKTFKDMLIHDLQPKGFADIYAQTVAYGMFAARLHDETLNDFSRQEAAELIPKSNPFLRKLFNEIAGPDIDERIVKIVDNLAEVFRATDIKQLLSNFGKGTQTQDPIIHFYETFLAAYDPKLRKARGVWYTPQPVVNFIVRAVDDILKTEFGLADGLADTSKTTITVDSQIPDQRSKTGYKQYEKEVHKVQILDPATGTGTFLAEVIRHIYSKKFKAMQGAWSGYVEEHLIPRLNGFELLMASYAMAHLKLDLLLKETGYKPQSNPRFNVYLTNSLEEYHPDTGTLFASWLSDEAREANHIKRDTPVMCVIGNPPYSISSYNQSKYIDSLMMLYKKDIKNEKNIQLLSDDYAKFIRFSHYEIEKTGFGIVGLITKNTYLNVTAFIGMRTQLLKYYDKIYVLDLRGKLYEKTPNGLPNENVFDIRVGTSIIFLIKNNSKKADTGQLFYKRLDGSRFYKYDFLLKNKIESISWDKLEPLAPYYFFEKKNFKNINIYQEGFKLDSLFKVNGSGVETGRDHFIIADNQKELTNRLSDFINSEAPISKIREKYKLNDQPKFNLIQIKNKFKTIFSNKFKSYSYKPFYNRTLYFDSLLLRRHSEKIMNNFLYTKENTALVLKKRYKENNYHHCFLTKNISDRNFLSGQTYIFPLYLYPETEKQQSLDSQTKRIPNLNSEIVKTISSKINLEFLPEEPQPGNLCMAQNPEVTHEFRTYFTPLNLLDYIYAVLHSPSYREKYKEFLKIDFPRVPYPKDTETFWKLVELGSQIRQIHLLESPVVEQNITSYPVDSNHEITRKMTKTSIGFEADKSNPKIGKVWINDEQYFDNVPLVAWNFYIGGYQPAQKWLKDRKQYKDKLQEDKRGLTYDEICHYQKIIVALTETDRLMKEIDKVEVE
ncbi:MAG: N-6 DNA methylase [Xanthomonadales bacterium]|nr:N-6 DNA methylase [Xanthomonadales bacterium]